ncbi:DUF3891 family protein [Mucilaginibacter conchicola]|uniref:DUF3891 family protein n=1 Tax=Mucilaginibacter conchicola TaxID=2303333 RepID=A0A372NNQ9_9SPHI|nr:DUF3891 family protein [Mucilaginibacter conchicola]RFZ90270.1 DUF3891 family protein [Mucilaginibacter conchicola]
MIVNYTAAGWEVITQRAHGNLSGMIAAQWLHAERTERWFETMIAVAGHDDARLEPDGRSLLTAIGTPLDFRMNGYDHEHCRLTLRSALSKSRYVALLSSMHLDFVYGKLALGSDDGRTLMQVMSADRENWREELGITEVQAQREYRLLEFCDALSLLLCQRHYQPERRRVEISTGPDGRPRFLMRRDDGTLNVSPWPFEADHFVVNVESRVIPQVVFTNDEAFRFAYASATVKINKWTFSKS